MSLRIIDHDTGELLPVTRALPQELFLDFERQDDDQILAELQGGVIEEYAYRFTAGGKTVVGLSLHGVMAVARQMGGITCNAPAFDNDGDDIVCDISATDHKTGNTVWGTASAARVMQTRNGAIPDRFARAKALSKAQRNAIHKLIPAAMALKMLEMALNSPKAIGERQAPKNAPALTAQGPRTLTKPQAADVRRAALENGYTAADISHWLAFNNLAGMSEMTQRHADQLRRESINGVRAWEQIAENVDPELTDVPDLDGDWDVELKDGRDTE